VTYSESVFVREPLSSLSEYDREYEHPIKKKTLNNSKLKLSKIRKILEADHTLKKWLAKDGPIVKYAEYYIGECKNYRWDLRVESIWNKTKKNIGTVRALRF